MTREELGHVTALRNMLHGAPMSQASLAWRLRQADRVLEQEWAQQGRSFRVRSGLDYWEIAGKWLDSIRPEG